MRTNSLVCTGRFRRNHPRASAIYKPEIFLSFDPPLMIMIRIHLPHQSSKSTSKSKTPAEIASLVRSYTALAKLWRGPD